MSSARILFIEAEGDACKQALASVAGLVGGMAGLTSLNVSMTDGAPLPQSNGVLTQALPAPDPAPEVTAPTKPKRKITRRKRGAPVEGAEAVRKEIVQAAAGARRPRGALRPKILDYLREHPLSTKRELAEGCGASWPGVHHQIEKMLAEGVIMMPARDRYKLSTIGADDA
jgi:hypothetical protein